MAQVKLNGGKHRIAVMENGRQVAKIEYRRVLNPKTGKWRRVLAGPIKLLPSPNRGVT